MPTIYECPADFGLKLVGEVEEGLVMEGFLRFWRRVAVWAHELSGDLLYAVETVPIDKPGSPFAWLTAPSELTFIGDMVGFRRFKTDLHDGERLPASDLTMPQRRERNRRARLQLKVRKRLFAR